MNKDELTKIVNAVVFDSEKYTQYYVAKFGISQGSFSQFRNKKRDIKNMRLNTILKIIDVYNSKQWY